MFAPIWSHDNENGKKIFVKKLENVCVFFLNKKVSERMANGWKTTKI